MQKENIQESSIYSNIVLSFFLIVFLWGIGLATIFQQSLKQILIKYSLSPEVIRAILSRSNLLNTGFSLIGIVVVIIVALFFAKFITASIRNLTIGVKELSKGNLDIKVKVISKDEMGILTIAFNQMVADLKKVTVSRDDLSLEIERRKRMEEELSHSEERFRIAANSITDLIYEWNIISGRLDWFGDIDRELGYAPGEFPRTLEAWEKVVHPDDHMRVMATIEQCLKMKQPFKVEYRVFQKDGTIVHWIDQGTAFFDERNNPYKWIGAVADITERKRREEEIKRNYETQSLINKLLSFSLEEVDIDEFMREALDLILSLSWADFQSRGAIFLIEDNPEVLVMKVQKGLSEPIQKECAFVPFGKCLCGRAALTKKTQFVSCLDELHEVRYEGMIPHGHFCIPIIFADRVLGVINIYLKEGYVYNQKLEEFLVALADVLSGIIERKNAQKELKGAYEQLKQTQGQLVQSAKMASVGLLAGGVAHEINNPLTGVLNNVQLIKMTTDGKKDINMDDIRDILNTIEESAVRCSRITRSLLDFSHVSKGIYENISLNDMVRKVTILIEHELRLQNITVKQEFSSELPSIYGDSQLLQQVIFDIISNAKWAIQKQPGEKGGTVTLRTSYEPRKKHVCVSISDTGIGIPQENLGKLFDPFFTTKPVGEGTGLGLSIVYNILKQHQGDIEVESKLNEGTTFKIFLPVASI